ncbi:hypothetical protein [Humibacter sp.]|uniref:hypothetical protein n=1 Tax=Humibacter sp. TaxID=1940291 RepID=UPI003F80E8A7
MKPGKIDRTDVAFMAEIAEWRRVHTFGGYVWPGGEERVDPRWRRSEELLDEVQWQLDMDVHPYWAAKAVGMNAVRLQRLAQRHKRPALARAFEAEIKYERGHAA